MGKVLHGSLLQLLLEHCDFLNIDISQGSVARNLRCGGIFKYEFVANLPVSLPVKEFWKSVNIWGSYRQEFDVLFFLRHSVYALLSDFEIYNYDYFGKDYFIDINNRPTFNPQHQAFVYKSGRYNRYWTIKHVNLYFTATKLKKDWAHFTKKILTSSQKSKLA